MTARYVARIAIRTMALVALSASLTSPVRGGNEKRMYLPVLAPGVPNKSGLAVEIETRWVESNGYRPIRVLVRSVTGPALADRNLLIEIKTQTWGQATIPSVSQAIELGEGQLSAEHTIYLPQTFFLNSFEVEVHENGRLMKGFRGYQSFVHNYNSDRWTEALPSILFLDADAPRLLDSTRTAMEQHAKSGLDRLKEEEKTYKLPDVRGIASRSNTNVRFEDDDQRAHDLETIRRLEEWPMIEMICLEDLPANWIGLSCFDLVFVSLSDLKILKQKYPERAKALRDWLSSGSTLCVFGTGQNFQQLAELERLLALSELPALDNTDQAAKTRNWLVPNRATLGQWYNIFDASRRSRRGGTRGGRSRPSAPARNVKSCDFVYRPVAYGQVFAIDQEDPFPGTRDQWNWLLRTMNQAPAITRPGVKNAVGAHRLKWYQRHGLSHIRENNDFWTWIVPGVGLPPVLSFLLLISLFVVTIGPLNYYFLSKSGRLYLLLVTVPLGALIVTSCLLIYALMGDGLGVKVRVRSMTLIDQHANKSVSWSRQSYYAAFAPSGGLKFPASSVVHEVKYMPNDQRHNRRTSAKQIVWQGDQRLKAGYLTSRTVGQFVVIDAAECEQELTIIESKQGQQPPQAENKLGTPIDVLVLRDHAGNHFHAENVRPGKSAQFRKISAEENRQLLATIFLEHRPAIPANFDEHEYKQALRRNPNNYYWGGYDYDSREPVPVLLGNLPNSFEKNGFHLDKRMYVAIVPESPAVPIGIKQARQLESFHVIAGTW